MILPRRTGASGSGPHPASSRGTAAAVAIATLLVPSIGWLLAAPSANAFETARELARQCQSVASAAKPSGRDVLIPGTKGALQCWGYMQAMQDLSVLSDQNGKRLMGACPSEQTTLLQLTRTFVAYARRHPDDLDNDAVLSVIKALQEAFPCPQTNAAG
jgi:hypothetical protein